MTQPAPVAAAPSPGGGAGDILKTSGVGLWEEDPACSPIGYRNRCTELLCETETFVATIKYTKLNILERAAYKTDMARIEWLSRLLNKAFNSSAAVGGDRAKLMDEFKVKVMSWTMRLLKAPNPRAMLRKLWSCSARTQLPLTNTPGRLQPFECVVARWTNALRTGHFEDVDAITDMYFEALKTPLDKLGKMSNGMSGIELAVSAGCCAVVSRMLYPHLRDKGASDADLTGLRGVAPLSVTAEDAVNMCVLAVAGRPNNMLMLAMLSNANKTDDFVHGTVEVDGASVLLLEYALRNNDYGVAGELVCLGADPLWLGSHDISMLQLAARLGSNHVVNIMLNEATRRARAERTGVHRLVNTVRRVATETLVAGMEGTFHTLIHWLANNTMHCDLSLVDGYNGFAAGRTYTLSLDTLMRDMASTDFVQVEHVDDAETGLPYSVAQTAVMFLLGSTPDWSPSVRAQLICLLLRSGYKLGACPEEAPLLEWTSSDWSKAIGRNTASPTHQWHLPDLFVRDIVQILAQQERATGETPSKRPRVAWSAPRV